jgi:hypothetical protein
MVPVRSKRAQASVRIPGRREGESPNGDTFEKPQIRADRSRGLNAWQPTAVVLRGRLSLTSTCLGRPAHQSPAHRMPLRGHAVKTRGRVAVSVRKKVDMASPPGLRSGQAKRTTVMHAYDAIKLRVHEP